MIQPNSVEKAATLPQTPKPWPHGPTKFEQRFGNNVTRIVVALVAIPLILGIVFLGGWWFVLLVAAMSAGALLEFHWMLEKRGIQANKKLGVVAGLLLLLPFAHGDFETLLGRLFDMGGASSGSSLQPAPIDVTVVVMVGLVLLTVVTTLIPELRRDNRQALQNMMATLSGFLYVSLFMATVLGVHHLAALMAPYLIDRTAVPDTSLLIDGTLRNRVGMNVFMVMLIGIWTCDSFAYFGGRAFGRHKLFERVSPKKTWEGAIAGAIAAIAACIGLSIALEGLVWYDGLFIGIAAGVFGQIGDLVESHIKRGCEVKDSSQLIPGHGGILDRFDSLLFVAPLVYIYLMIVVLSLR